VLERYEAFCLQHGLDAAEAVAPQQLMDPADAERLESLGYL